MENIIIEIKSVIEQLEGEKSRIEMTTIGELFEKNGSIYVVYFESEVSGMQGCKTVLKILGDIITMTRFGDTTSKIIFDKEVPMKSIYHTPYGDFDMEVNTMKLISKIKPYELSGEIDLEYNIVVKNLSASINQLSIIIKRVIIDE